MHVNVAQALAHQPEVVDVLEDFRILGAHGLAMTAE